MSTPQPDTDAVSVKLMRERMRHLRDTDERYVVLRDRLKELEVELCTAHLESGLLGYYAHEAKTVVLDVNLSPRELLTVLAHEVGHAVYGHDRADVPFFERAADQWAARALIDPERWADHVTVSESTEWLAQCFGVKEEVVTTYKQIVG